MFRGQGLAKPRGKSLLGALAVMILAIVGSQASPELGYLFALSALVMMLVVILRNSVWPTQSKRKTL